MENLPKPGSSAASSEQKPDQNPRTNPVCLEVGVTLRSLPGEKDAPSAGVSQPAREEARTVIVFDNGAVLRIANHLPPGQAVILSNAQGRDVVCRVVNARSSPNVKGYIEVEFLEPATDFWGIHNAEAKPAAPNTPAAGVAQPKPATPPQPPQIASSAPQPETSAPLPAPGPIRSESATTEPVAASSRAPSFEDVAGVVRLTPPPIAYVKTTEQSPRLPVSRKPEDSTLNTSEPPRSYSKVDKAAVATELTSLSAGWDSTPQPGRKPSTSYDVLGKFSHTTSESASSRSSGKMPLIVGAAAVVALAFGAGIYFLGSGNLLAPRVAPVAAVSQPVARVPAAPANTPKPEASAVADQTAGEETPQALPLTPATSTTLAIPKEKEIAATPAPPAQQTPRRKTDNAAATQSTQLGLKKPEAPTPRSDSSRNLKMSTPTADSQSGRLVDGSVPNVDDAIVTGAAKVPGEGLISTATHPNLPPPPGGFVGASSSGTVRTEPRLISSTRPVYPQLAKQSGVAGDVILAADIDATGRVIAARATDGPMYLRQAAVDAVRNWKYEPANLNGKPTSAQISIKIEFRLK